MLDSLAILGLLLGLELVLGIDNVLVIAIFVSRLPEDKRNRARIFGLILAMFARILMLFVVLALSQLTQPLIFSFSVRDLILLAGGLFLLVKAVREIHNTVELKDEEIEVCAANARKSFYLILMQIVLLDLVFSIDSVITAVGFTNEVWVIVIAVVVSFAAIMVYSKPVSEFIMRFPTVKILALSFLITIGITIFLEGLHQNLPKAYIYIPMGFALAVDMLQMRYQYNRKMKRAAARDKISGAPKSD